MRTLQYDEKINIKKYDKLKAKIICSFIELVRIVLGQYMVLVLPFLSWVAPAFTSPLEISAYRTVTAPNGFLESLLRYGVSYKNVPHVKTNMKFLTTTQVISIFACQSIFNTESGVSVSM